MAITTKDVAQWMLDEINSGNYLYQEQAAYSISDMFGDDFVYINQKWQLGNREKST